MVFLNRSSLILFIFLKTFGERSFSLFSERAVRYTTEFRQLAPRLGRWFSVDPVFHPWESPYVSMNNNPICINDIYGLEGNLSIGGKSFKESKLEKGSAKDKELRNASTRFKRTKMDDGTYKNIHTDCN